MLACRLLQPACITFQPEHCCGLSQSLAACATDNTVLLCALLLLLLLLRYREFTFNPVGYPAAELAAYVSRCVINDKRARMPAAAVLVRAHLSPQLAVTSNTLTMPMTCLRMRRHQLPNIETVTSDSRCALNAPAGLIIAQAIAACGACLRARRHLLGWMTLTCQMVMRWLPSLLLLLPLLCQPARCRPALGAHH
jgi:hypothetical protein